METRVPRLGDVDAVLDLLSRSFGPGSARRRPAAIRAIGDGRIVGVYDGARLVACGQFHAFEQWWHGRPVPMAGVAGVCVAPEERGRGVGRRLAAALLDLVGDRPLSVLFPATAPVYRSVGYEHAGAQHRLTLPAEPLRALVGGPVAVRRAGPADAAKVTALLRRLHADACHDGPIDPGEERVRDMLGDNQFFCHLADDGFLAYGWDLDRRDRIRVDRCVAGSAATARALWAMVGSGASITPTVQANVGPDDPLLWLLRDRAEDEMRRVSWMLRVLDAPAAIAARGFPPGLSADVPLVIEDEQRPRNTGAWLLTVRDGEGRLERAPEHADAVRLPARGLAALYAGVPAATLRGTGLATGGAAAGPLLDAAFGATPFMLDYF